MPRSPFGFIKRDYKEYAEAANFYVEQFANASPLRNYVKYIKPLKENYNDDGDYIDLVTSNSIKVENEIKKKKHWPTRGCAPLFFNTLHLLHRKTDHLWHLYNMINEWGDTLIVVRREHFIAAPIYEKPCTRVNDKGVAETFIDQFRTFEMGSPNLHIYTIWDAQNDCDFADGEWRRIDQYGRILRKSSVKDWYF